MSAVPRFAVCAGLLMISLACGPQADDADTKPVETGAGADGGAVRRVVEGCEPGDELSRYAGFVGGRALVVLLWDGMPERAAELRIPVHVVGVEGGSVRVQFLQFPMREQYLNIWLGSGHIAAAGDNVFRLEPCSARITPWPDPGRATE